MSHFQFQQFSVMQNQSGMKLCTDSLLFGAMAPVRPGDKILDIGSGSGVLSLMAAQLGAEKVTAVELTREAHEEAHFNFNESPWPEKIEAVHQDIRSFTSKQRYDLIISNPPFFENHSKTLEALRNIARHNDQLPFTDLICIAESLLSKQGLFYCLIPGHVVERFCAQAFTAGLYPINQTDIRGYAHQKSKVSALTFSRTQGEFKRNVLTVYESAGVYSQESEAYLTGFLLRFSKTKNGQS